LEWVEHDRPRYWKNQNRLAAENLHEAQAALQRCIMFPKTVNERPACAEERQAVKMAQARVAYCEHTAQRVRHWKQALPHEVQEFKGRVARLKRLVELDLPHAIGVLGTILRRLEEYSAVSIGSAGGAYNDVALAQEIWPIAKESEATPAANTTPDGEPASASGPAAERSEG
jgi:hypothetical protein